MAGSDEVPFAVDVLVARVGLCSSPRPPGGSVDVNRSAVDRPRRYTVIRWYGSVQSAVVLDTTRKTEHCQLAIEVRACRTLEPRLPPCRVARQ